MIIEVDDVQKNATNNNMHNITYTDSNDNGNKNKHCSASRE